MTRYGLGSVRSWTSDACIEREPADNRRGIRYARVHGRCGDTATRHPDSKARSRLVEDDSQTGAAVWDNSSKLTAEQKGTKLYPHEAGSLPPVDAVFRYGSSAVQEWLRSEEWQPDWGYNENFRDTEPVEEYERVFQAQSPLHAGGEHALLGGWHFP